MSKKWNISIPDEILVESYYYLINGKKYWRITRVKGVINQPGINNWRVLKGKKESSNIMRVRQEYGTKFHKLVELILNDKKLIGDYDKEMKLDLESFNKFKSLSIVETESVEQRLYSDSLKVAGTADGVIKYKSNIDFLKRNIEPKFIKPSMVIIDWKTSSAIYKDYWLQIAAYVFIFEEITGLKLDGGVIVQFRNGKIHVEEKTREELKCQFEIFKNCIKLFEYVKEGC